MDGNVGIGTSTPTGAKLPSKEALVRLWSFALVMIIRFIQMVIGVKDQKVNVSISREAVTTAAGPYITSDTRN
jgi:hypothetical protein